MKFSERRQLTTADELKGQVIEAVCVCIGSSRMLMRFAGGNYAVLEASSGYGGEIDLSLNCRWTPLANSYESVEMGLISETEMQELREETARRSAQDKEIRMRQDYMRLKDHFEKRAAKPGSTNDY